MNDLTSPDAITGVDLAVLTSGRKPTRPVRQFLICLTSLMIFATSAFAEVFVVTDDTFTHNRDATVNFGSDLLVKSQSWSDITAFASFSFSSTSETSVDIATLKIPVNAVNKAGVIEIYQVMGSWSESGLTHNTRPALDTVPVAAFLVNSGDNGQTVSIDITPLVNLWLANAGTNFGLALVPTDVNMWSHSKESGSGMEIETSSLITTPTPANRFPQSGDANISTNPTLDLTCSSTTLASAQYQISSQPDFSSIDYDSGTVSDDICSHRATANLADLTNYYWRGRQQLQGGTWSAWSTATLFTVADSTLLAENLFQDGQLTYSGTRDADIRGSGIDPAAVIRNWNQGAQDVIRTGRRPGGSSTDEIYRTLVNFDISALSNSGAVVNAWIELTGWQHDDASHNLDVSVVNSVYTLLKPWGEGNGIIAAPLAGEASWVYSESTTLWSAPGAGLASDTAPNADRTATAVITSRPRNLVGIKSTWTSREFLNLVKFWIDNPSQNFGMLLKANDESIRFMMNFAAREHADSTYRPKLVIETSESVAVPENTAPQINAGADSAAETGATHLLRGSASDDGLPTPPGSLAILWSQLSGPGTADFAESGNPSSSVSFDTAGVYTLQLLADDGALQTSDQVVVTVSQSAGQSISASQDAYTSSRDAATVFGSAADVRVQNWSSITGFARFDLSSYAPGSTVSSATLKLSVLDVKKIGPMTVHKVLGDWSESDLTHNSRPPLGAAATTVNIAFADEGQTISIDVTDLVNQLLTDPPNDFGIALVPDNVNVWFNSKESGSPMQVTTTSGGPTPNVAPTAAAGADFGADLNTATALSGSVSDDDKPLGPGTVTAEWSQISGPVSGTAMFANAFLPTTDVSFDAIGDYVLRLTADDSLLTHFDEVTVTVIDPNVNVAPTANAGADFAVNINTIRALAGSVSDDGRPGPTVTTSWAQVSGPGGGTADFTDSFSPATDVSFDVAGDYVLRLTADDSLLTHTDDVTVTASEPGSQQVFTVMQDAYTRNNTPSTSYGSDTDVRVQNWANITGFARFDLSSYPPGSVVSSATLQLSVLDVKKVGPFTINKVLGDWSETDLTENNKPALGPATTSFTVSFADDGQTVMVDVTDVFNELLTDPGNDFGLALVPDSVNVWFDSHESGTPMRIVAGASGPVSNTAPTANAGSDFSMTVNVTSSLAGLVSDDGLPNPPGTTSGTWSVVTNPGGFIFSDISDPTSPVSFDTTGDYVLRLTADDGEYTHTDDVTITVVDPGTQQTFLVAADTYTSNRAVTTNFGTDNDVRVQNWANITGFARFDLSSFPPGSTVSAATLGMGVLDVKKAGQFSIHKVLGDWSETGLIENNKPALGPAITSFAISFSDDGQSILVDITTVLNQLLADPLNDFGFALVPNNVNVWFDSRESGTPMQIDVVPATP